MLTALPCATLVIRQDERTLKLSERLERYRDTEASGMYTRTPPPYPAVPEPFTVNPKPDPRNPTRDRLFYVSCVAETKLGEC